MSSLFLQHLAKRRLVFDGAMGTATHTYELSVDRDYCGCENCTEILVASRPDVVGAIHESFLQAGCDVLETCTFGGMPHVLAEFDLQARSYELNKSAAELAKSAAAKYSDSIKPRFVAGSVGPGTKLITLGNIDWRSMHDSYRAQALGLIDGGVDCFIIETCQDLLQIKCALNGIISALADRGKTPVDVPLMVSVTIESTGTMLLGSEIAAAAHALSSFPICSLGLNCATGPVEMKDHVRWLARHWPAMGTMPGIDAPRRVSVMPNAGLPVLVDGRTEFPLGAQDFAAAMEEFLAHDNVGIVGGCCGTRPAHIKAIADEVESLERAGRTRGKALIVDAPAPIVPEASVTSLYSPTPYRQDNSILIVGERMNASGSRAFKKLLETEDYDGIVSLAREQVRHDGAHVLDLNVDYAGRDNARDMSEIVRRLVRQVNVPLMLDSTQIATIEAGLMHSPGKCIINSANFEDGEHKFDTMCQLALKYGAALVIGSIDEDKEASMARTAERKLAIAARGFERAVKVHGLAPEDIMFDPLVLPISTGMESDRRSGAETIEGVRRIMQSFPNCQTTVGLSNCSFGLKPAARVVLNSVFLHELTQAGLTSAIVHFSKILPRTRISDEHWNAALDLVYDRRREGFDPLQAFVELFKDVEAGQTAKREAKALTVEEALRAHIIDGEKEGLDDTLKRALERFTPLAIINDHLLDGMKTVGELFGSGRMQLPFVLQSAEVMKLAVAKLEPLMERVDGQAKGTLVLATVKGDVHDIGKNLVDIILTNNGYRVINLGIKQQIPDIINAWREHKADAIGLSGLLVKSVNVMEEYLKELNDRKLTPPVILGGAALTRHYCEGHLRSVYQGACYYGKDAFDGLRTMDMIVGGQESQLASEIDARMAKRSDAEDEIITTRAAKLAKADQGGDVVATGVRSDVSITNLVPKAPFFGTRTVTGIDLDHIYPFINPVALFRGQWQMKKGAATDEEYEALIEDEVRPIFEKWKSICKNEKILEPKVVYGYFPCNSDGDDLVIWADENRTAERLRFTFPRQADKRRLCISDFFRPVSSAETDVIGMHCVTMGSNASARARELFESNNYADYLYLHGLGVETAEALAEFWHKRMRQELGIAGEDSPRTKELFTQKYRGSRYSFGYPACPNMSDQLKLFELLEPARIGCTLTENYQIDPEQSTSAIIVHHPEAKYFNV